MYIFAQATSILSDAWLDKWRLEAALHSAACVPLLVVARMRPRILSVRFCVMIPAANGSDQMIRPTQMLRKLSSVFLLFALACARLAAQTATTKTQTSQKQTSGSQSAQPLAENKQGVVQPAY